MHETVGRSFRYKITMKLADYTTVEAVHVSMAGVARHLEALLTAPYEFDRFPAKIEISKVFYTHDELLDEQLRKMR